MNGYDEESIARSVRRYLAYILPPPWNVVLQRQEVRDDQRPAGLVEIGMARQRRARVSIPQGEVEMFAPVTLTLYPRILGGQPADASRPPLEPRVTAREARLLSHQLLELITSGLDPDGDLQLLLTTGRPACGPERLPLWDYTDSDPGEAGPERPIDILWAEDYSVRPLQDPEDARRWSVIVEMRVSWERPGRKEPDAPIAQALRPEPELRL